MNAEGELLHAYRQWQRLAQAESRAIQTRNWALFNDCHQAIQAVQASLANLAPGARAEWLQRDCLAEKEKELHLLLSALMDLTRQNQSLLATARQTAQQRLSRLGEAGNNLKRLRQSYGGGPGLN